MDKKLKHQKIGMVLRGTQSYMMVTDRSRKYLFLSKLYKIETGLYGCFEGVQSDVMYTAQYGRNSDVGTTYLGTSKMRTKMS